MYADKNERNGQFYQKVLWTLFLCLHLAIRVCVCVCVSVCVTQIYKFFTHMSKEQHQCCGLVGHETMLFVHMQKLVRGTYTYSMMIIESGRSTKTFLQFYPTTWCHICLGHNYDPTARTSAFRTLCRQSQLPKTLHGTKISYSYSGSQNIPRAMSSGRINFIECCPIYDGWNFNSGNYLFTTDTK